VAAGGAKRVNACEKTASVRESRFSGVGWLTLGKKEIQPRNYCDYKQDNASENQSTGHIHIMRHVLKRSYDQYSRAHQTGGNYKIFDPASPL
jgi:hypothetical protein